MVDQSHSEKIEQIVIRLFLGRDRLVDAVEAATRKIVCHLCDVSFNGYNFARIDFVPRDELYHAVVSATPKLSAVWHVSLEARNLSMKST